MAGFTPNSEAEFGEGHLTLIPSSCPISLTSMDVTPSNAANTWTSGIPHLDELWKINDARVLRLAKVRPFASLAATLPTHIIPIPIAYFIFHRMILKFQSDRKLSHQTSFSILTDSLLLITHVGRSWNR